MKYPFSKYQRLCFYMGLFGFLVPVAFVLFAFVDLKLYGYALIFAIGFLIPPVLLTMRSVYALGYAEFDETGIWSQVGRRKCRFLPWDRIKRCAVAKDPNSGITYLILSLDPLVMLTDYNLWRGKIYIPYSNALEFPKTLAIPADAYLIRYCSQILEQYGVPLSDGKHLSPTQMAEKKNREARRWLKFLLLTLVFYFLFIGAILLWVLL